MKKIYIVADALFHSNLEYKVYILSVGLYEFPGIATMTFALVTQC